MGRLGISFLSGRGIFLVPALPARPCAIWGADRTCGWVGSHERQRRHEDYGVYAPMGMRDVRADALNVVQILGWATFEGDRDGTAAVSWPVASWAAIDYTCGSYLPTLTWSCAELPDSGDEQWLEKFAV